MTPTARTLAYLRGDLGMQAEVVERWNAHAKIRQDLFGFADVLAASEDRGILAVQATSTPNVSARIHKIRDEPRVYPWLAAGGRVWVIGWAKRGARGKRKLWTPRIIEILTTMEVDVEEEGVAA